MKDYSNKKGCIEQILEQACTGTYKCLSSGITNNIMPVGMADPESFHCIKFFVSLFVAFSFLGLGPGLVLPLVYQQMVVRHSNNNN
jgi:hypothetical protein